MNIRKSDPPAALTVERKAYSDLVEMLKTLPDTWLELEPADIGGPTITQKQIRLHMVARHRGIKVKTVTGSGKIWIKSLVEEPQH